MPDIHLTASVKKASRDKSGNVTKTLSYGTGYNDTPCMACASDRQGCSLAESSEDL